MRLIYLTREFYPDELRILKTLRTKKGKSKSGQRIKFHYYIVATLSGAGSTFVAASIPDSFWTFLFGTIAVFSFAFIVFTPYEVYKQYKRNGVFLRELNSFIDRGTVDTCVIHAKRIVLAKEYDDEGDLYIIEYDTDQLLYLWDYDYNLKKSFPCLDFEIYEERFYHAFDRQIYPLSDRIKPLIIDKEAKWAYLNKIGGPEHLHTESKNLDLLIDEYNKAD